jgi:hypothetical protein
MALLEDILGQVEGMGFGAQDYMGLANLTPETISSKLQQYFGLTGQDIPAHMFQGISADVLRSGLGKTYSPQLAATGDSMLSQLRDTMMGQKTRQAYGGFAGSSAGREAFSSAKDVYGKGMTDVLGQTSQQRLQGLQNVQNQINQWRDTALKIKGTI